MTTTPHFGERLFRPHGACPVRLLWAVSLLAGIAAVAIEAHADEAASRPVASKHQMMKECMAKQKASDAGLSKEQMKKNCRDVTETERENAKADKTRTNQATGTPQTK